jgi:hypothetical protein
MEYMQAHKDLSSQAPNKRLINVVFRRTLSEIKLKRTDTTLDLSQNGKESWRRKEEKRSKQSGGWAGIYISLEEWSVRR